MGPTDVFSSTSGRVLTGATALAAVLVVASLAGDVPVADLVLAASLSALAVLAVWAVLARPEVEVSDGTVVLRNVLRTVTVPWPALRGTEVGWSLVVHTTGGAWTAWAAPRAGGARRAVPRRASARAHDDAGLREARAAAGAPHDAAVSTGDGRRRHPASAEAVAAAIEARHEALHRAGHLAGADVVAAAHGIRPTVTWHTGTLGGALALLAVAAVSRLG